MTKLVLRIGLADQFVIGYAVGFALAGGAMAANPKLVELIHERANHRGVVRENA